jgi:hypothetical protein
MVFRFFGPGAIPNFSGTKAVLDRDPYRPLRDQFSERWRVADSTDLNYDVSFQWGLLDHPEPLTLRLSMVGPYAVIIRRGTELVDDPEIDAILVQAGFIKLSKDILSLPVPTWEPEYSAALYEFLFAFDEGLPWE